MNIDYNIHGWLGLRLVDPPHNLIKLVARQMDPLVPDVLPMSPDVSLITDEGDRVKTTSHRLGDAGDQQQCAFNDGEFCFLQVGGPLYIPFESIGESCEIRYAPGLNLRRMFLAYVRPILQLSLLPKGALAVHSAAVLYKGKGILFAGWAESGKTEAMLAFVHQGASFISDKWTIIARDGSAICNFPTPITARAWLLAHTPELSGNLTTMQRLRVRLGAAATATANRIARQSGIELVERVGALITPLLNVASGASVTPSRLLLGGRSDRNLAPRSLTAPLVKVFLLITSNDPRVVVKPADPADVVARLVDCGQYERRVLQGSYTKFRYAFPNRRNSLIDEARHLEAEMLSKAFEGKEIYTVETPFPFDPLRLHDAVDRFC